MAKEKDKHEEEFIPLSGQADPKSVDQSSDSLLVDPEEGHVGLIEQRKAKASLNLDPAATDDDVVNAVIRAPKDTFLPWEECELPSRGYYYNWTSGMMQVRPWGASVDRIFATGRLAQTGQSLDYVFEECCQFPSGFSPRDLLVGDQVFLLYYLRGITHGNIYEFAVTSPSGSMSTHMIDLNDMAGTVQWADRSLGDEPFRITLPYLSTQVDREFTVGLRFLRVRDVQAINRKKAATKKATAGSQRTQIRQKRQQQRRADRDDAWQPHMPANRGDEKPKPDRDLLEQIPIDDTLSKNMETLIVDVNHQTDRYKIRQIIDKLHSSDMATIREWLADHTPGMDTQVQLEDSDTGAMFPVMLPITESFFRPQTSDARAVE